MAKGTAGHASVKVTPLLGTGISCQFINHIWPAFASPRSWASQYISVETDDVSCSTLGDASLGTRPKWEICPSKFGGAIGTSSSENVVLRMTTLV